MADTARAISTVSIRIASNTCSTITLFARCESTARRSNVEHEVDDRKDENADAVDGCDIPQRADAGLER